MHCLWFFSGAVWFPAVILRCLTEVAVVGLADLRLRFW